MVRIHSTTANGALSLISLLLLLATIPQHGRSRNTGTLIIIGWACLGCFAQSVTSFLLQDTETVITPSIIRWCDFAAVVGYTYPLGVSAGFFILLQKLESIASTRQVSANPRLKYRSLIIDLAIGLLLPLLLIPLRFVVQGHRMNIITGYNCNAPVYYSAPAIPLVLLPPLILETVNLVYAGMVLRWFIIRRRQFAALLHSSGTGMSKNRYMRLMLVSLAEMLVAWPISLFFLISSVKNEPLQPYVSWDYVHEGFDTTYEFDYAPLSDNLKASIEISRWLCVYVGFCFFGFFGFLQFWSSAKDLYNKRTGAQTNKRQCAANSSFRDTTFVSNISYRDTTERDAPSSCETPPAGKQEFDLEASKSEWVSMDQLHAAFPVSQHVLVSSERRVDVS